MPSSSRLAIISICGPFLLATLCAGARVSAQAPKPPDTAVLSGSPLGDVKMSHKLHATQYGAKCETCHHAAKPEKPLKAEHQKCADCHTKVAAAPMKTKAQAAFHDPLAKKGTCVDCHAAAKAKGNTKVPVLGDLLGHRRRCKQRARQ